MFRVLHPCGKQWFSMLHRDQSLSILCQNANYDSAAPKPWPQTISKISRRFTLENHASGTGVINPKGHLDFWEEEPPTVNARILPLVVLNAGHREVDKRKGGAKNVLAAHYEPKAHAQVDHLLRPQRHLFFCRRRFGVAQFFCFESLDERRRLDPLRTSRSRVIPELQRKFRPRNVRNALRTHGNT